MKKQICKNCTHYKWAEQFCRKTQTYVDDVSVCSMFESVYEEQEISEGDVGSIESIFGVRGLSETAKTEVK